MNFDPKLWGPHAWDFMHYITVGYPINPSDIVKKNAYNMFMSLKYLLPCESCRHNFTVHVDRRPLTDEILSSRDRLVNWLIDLHNDVNAAGGKKLVSYDYVLEKYINKKNDSSNFFCSIDSRIYVVAGSLLLIIILIIMLRYNIV